MTNPFVVYRLFKFRGGTMATTFFRLSPPSSFLSPAQFTKPIYFRNSKINNPITRIRCSNTPPQPPGTECPVPPEQQPVNEYNSLSTSFPFSSAAGDAVEFYSRLFVTGAAFALFVGFPVAWFGAPGADLEPLKRILAGATSGVLVVTIIVVRMYLGWAYVGNRLLSATVEYEETGWYDGQIWVKTPEILARDRLLGSFSVKPVLSRLKYTLISLAVILVVCARLLINLEGGQTGLSVKGGSEAGGDRSVPGVYSDESARSFEPDAFCGEPALSQ